MDTKYDKIGKGYNSTRQADPYIVERLLYHLQPKSDKLYLDIGCGTGNYTIALADKGFSFTGAEPSLYMLNEARNRNPDIRWINGTAEDIPAADNTFDGIIATLTIHHWSDLKKAFIEINRVLTDNGKFVLFTSTPEQMKGYWLNHYFPEMLRSSIIQMPSLSDLQEAAIHTELEITETEKYFIRHDLLDSFLYVGKYNPYLYFDESVRCGISSFSSLANAAEVKQGLSELKEETGNGIFDKIKERYASDLGDYLFITFTRKGRF